MKTTLVSPPLVAVCIASLLLSSPVAGHATTPDVAKLVAEAASYQPGQSREPFRQLENLLREPSSGTRKELESGLIQLAGPKSTYEAREFACTQLGIIGSSKALPILSDMLKHEDSAGLACLALTTYPSGKADSLLRSALSAAQGLARLQIITTLGDRRDAKAVKDLAVLARNSDDAVAAAALASLGKIGNEAAWKAIATVAMANAGSLQLAVTEASLRCAQGLVNAGKARIAQPIYEGLLGQSQPAYVRRAALNDLLRLDQEHAQQRILEVLRGSDAAVKPVAIAAVRVLPSANASDVFADELPKLTSQEQVWMIDSLAVRGDAAACSALAKSVFSTEAAVRLAAIDALARIGNAWTVPLFARALGQAKSVEERRALSSALIGLRGGSSTDRALTTAIKGSSAATRAELISALSKRQGATANALLLAEAEQSDAVAAKAALRALARTAGAKDASPLLQRLTATGDAEVRAEAVAAVAHALAQMPTPARRSALVCQALRWPQSQASRSALLALLPVCGDAAALSALNAATSDPDSAVREAAVRALAEWPDMAAWDALSGVYRQPGREVLRGLALRGLVRLATEANAHPDAKLVERYRQLIGDARTDADRRLILGALAGAGQPATLELALTLLNNPGVRAEAAAAVKQIAEAIKAQHPEAAGAALKRLQSAAKAP